MDFTKDQLERRCPRLGGAVSFQYCRETGENELPCWKIADCWWESFDIMEFLYNNYSRDQVDRIVQAKPKPKLSSLLELIEQAQKRKE